MLRGLLPVTEGFKLEVKEYSWELDGEKWKGFRQGIVEREALDKSPRGSFLITTEGERSRGVRGSDGGCGNDDERLSWWILSWSCSYIKSSSSCALTKLSNKFWINSSSSFETFNIEGVRFDIRHFLDKEGVNTNDSVLGLRLFYRREVVFCPLKYWIVAGTILESIDVDS